MESSINHKKRTTSDGDDLNGILNLWNKFTLKSDSPSSITYHHFFHSHHQAEAIKKSKNITIYLKSPYVLSGGIIEGTIALSLLPTKKIQQLELILHGIEIVFDPVHYSTSTHAHHFLNLPILALQQPNDYLDQLLPEDTKIVPFTIKMPLNLGSTYKDKKGCVQYILECHAKFQQYEEAEEKDNIWFTDRFLDVYQNVQKTEQTSLCQPINEHRRIWERRLSTNDNNENSHVDVNINLPKSIWTAGSSLYVNMRIENKSMHKMRDVKLDLIKRQNTYWQTRLHKSFDLMPVTSTCELVASTSLISLGWWQALGSQSNDHVMIPLEIPGHEFTIKHQKLIDVSFALRISITSLTSTEAITEIPITLVHPISADPPPGSNFTTSIVKSDYVKSLVYSPSLPLYARNHHHKSIDGQALALQFPSSAGSSSIWSAVSLTYSPFMPITTNSTSPPPPPVPPKQQQHSLEEQSHSTKISDNDLTVFTTSSPTEELSSLNSHHRNLTSASILKSDEIRIYEKEDSHTQLAPHRKKVTMVGACEALVHHTADKCKSAFFSSSWSSAVFNLKKKPLVQKLSNSFSSGIKSSSNATIHHPPSTHSKYLAYDFPKIPTSGSDIVSPSGTMFVMAPSQKFEISVQELDLLCHSPSSPASYSPRLPTRRQKRHHKGLNRIWSLKRKRKHRQFQNANGPLD